MSGYGVGYREDQPWSPVYEAIEKARAGRADLGQELKDAGLNGLLLSPGRIPEMVEGALGGGLVSAIATKDAQLASAIVSLKNPYNQKPIVDASKAYETVVNGRNTVISPQDAVERFKPGEEITKLVLGGATRPPASGPDIQPEAKTFG